jgi:inosine/xanthosine triphosphatase
MFPQISYKLIKVDAPSQVSAQPISSQETLQGALNRVSYVRDRYPQAAFWTAIEGGVDFDNVDQMSAFAWVVIQNVYLCGKARSGSFFLPPKIAGLVKSGLELGQADDLVFGQANSKQKNGAVGLLTGDILTRTSLYEQAVLMALIPFKNPQLYS